jgi:hypothetical protein
MSARPVLFVKLAGNLKRFPPGQQESRTSDPPICSGFRQKGGKGLVKQRFLTHFKPWLIAVTKACTLIVTYQLLDQIRTRLQHPPLNISDVLRAATIALFALALFCTLWAWGEWCCFKLRRFRGAWSAHKLAFAAQRNQRKLEAAKRDESVS